MSRNLRRAPVLVVDDDQDSRESLRDLLEVWGYDVKTAANGEEALASLAKSGPSLILLDLQMPVMDGREFLAKVRQSGRHSHVPIAIVSGQDSRPEGYKVFRKPIDSEHLRSFLSRTVGTQQTLRVAGNFSASHESNPTKAAKHPSATRSPR